MYLLPPVLASSLPSPSCFGVQPPISHLFVGSISRLPPLFRVHLPPPTYCLGQPPTSHYFLVPTSHFPLSATPTSISVDKHAPIIRRVVTVRPKTPWHRKELSCSKLNLRRAERRWRKTRLVVHRQICTTLPVAYRRQLTTTTKASHFCTVVH